MTNERTLPVLQAAHIKLYTLEGPHDLNNGLLLRSNLHTLFDQGYVTVDPKDMRIVMSPRIRQECEWPALLRTPWSASQAAAGSRAMPAVEHLSYHAEHVFG
jgi:putative restriction endonuclease